MRILRGGLLVLVSILLLISLFVGNIFWTISSSLEYKNVYPEISSFVNQGYGMSSYIDNNYNSFLDYCLPHENYTYKNNFGTFIIPCSRVSLGIDSTLNFILDENSSLKEQPILVNLSNQVISSHSKMKDYCSAHEVYFANISRMNLSCKNVIEGKEQLKEAVLKSSVDEIYYKEYNCGFWDCIKKTGSVFFLVSEKAVNYWNSKFYISLLVSFVLIVVSFFLLKTKSNLFFLSGSLIVLSSLPLLKFEALLLFLIKFSLGLFGSSSLLSSLGYLNTVDPNIIFSILSVFFSRSSFVFWMMFIFGILLILAGIVFKFWSYFSGRTKQMFSRREVESIVQAEIKKSKSSKK